MADPVTFKRGDVVLHSRRPEWGEGLVDQASPATHEGRPAQRLVIRFANQGFITINTGVASLLPKEAVTTMSGTGITVSPASPPPSATATAEAPASSSGGWLASLGKSSNGHGKNSELFRLPDAMTDPFVPVDKRLHSTLESYRFTTDPKHLLDWAVAQTALSDPLSRYTRSELEQAFYRFARDRDQHLQDLVRQLKKLSQSGLIREAMQGATRPQAKEALQRAMQRS